MMTGHRPWKNSQESCRSMDHPGFFENVGPFSLQEIAELVDAQIIGDGDRNIELVDVKPLQQAASGHVAFFENRKYQAHFEATKASVCIISEKDRKKPSGAMFRLVVPDAYRAYATVVDHFYPEATRPLAHGHPEQESPSLVHSSARLEDGVIVEPGAVIGEGARIGRGTRILSGAVVGYRCFIGRNCLVAANASISCSIIGDNVIIHQGAAIGQDGFGFAMGPEGHRKVPQIGRVIIQDSVEIGANTTIDRGALGDTVIGEGSKIDNLVQIGHNVVLGRHCVIVSQVGISGSTELGDFVIMGGQAGCIGHVNIGAGAKIAANGKITNNVAPGATLGGAPAVPIMQWKREIIALKHLAARKK